MVIFKTICACCGELTMDSWMCVECKATFCETCAVEELTECEECGVWICKKAHVHEWGDEKHLCANCREYKLPEGEL